MHATLAAPTHGPSRRPTSPKHLAYVRGLDRRIRALERERREREGEQARHLVELQRIQGHLDLGFPSLAAYAACALEWPDYRIRDLNALARRLPDLPRTSAELFGGVLEWCKAVAIARAHELDPDEIDEEEALEQAHAGGIRELRRYLKRRLGQAVTHQRHVRDLSDEQAAFFDEAIRALRSEGFEGSDGDAVVELMRRGLSGAQTGGTKFRVHLTHDLSSGETTISTRAGEAPVRAATAERILCDAEVQLPSGEVKRTAPVRVQNKIVARSKGRCEVPNCPNRAYLEFHHNDEGGWRAGHDPDRMLHLCSAHHTALHERRLRIEGSWSAGLVFLLADGAVLATAGGPGSRTSATTSSRTSATTGSRTSATTGSRTSARAKSPRSDSQGRSEPEVAVAALRVLQLSAREATRLVGSVLAERPELAGNADAIVHAALVLHPR